MKSKVCTICKNRKILGAFHKNKANKDGLAFDCKECRNTRNRKKYKNDKAHREKVLERGRKYRQDNLEVRRKAELKSKYKTTYGITLEEKQQLYLMQNGECAICGKSVSYNKINIDHNHITNKIRGLLCFTCNTGIGSLKTDSEGVRLLENAIHYIKQND
jgi:hypothetical protein